jgi:hypothetical protein
LFFSCSVVFGKALIKRILSHENLNFITFGSHDAKLASESALKLEEQSRQG